MLRSLDFNPETLLVLFKSPIIQALLKQACSGTILTSINRDELDKVLLPLVDSDIQKQIAALIQKSFQLRSKSRHLLDSAKRAVEVAIEKGEDAATQVL